MIVLDRYKRDGKGTKEIPLIGTGFHSFIDHLFWYLPFSNVKQAFTTLDAVEGVTEADWETKKYAEYEKKYAEYGRKYAEYEEKYAEYEKKYAEYGEKYAEYGEKYAEYGKKYAEYGKKYA